MNLTQELLNKTLAIAEQAGKKILEIYQRDNFEIQKKADHSPLTEADLAAHEYISAELATITPNIPVLSEESSKAEIADRKNWPVLWLVDPLDGTKEFIHRSGEFTVNIALIVNHQPVLGVVTAPAMGTSYFAMQDFGAFKKQDNKTSAISAKLPGKITRVIASRRHGNNEELEKFLQQIPGEYELVQAGSALKLCLVAEGAADIYPRLAPTCEWDTAAGEAVLNQANGKLYDTKGREFTYNYRNELLNGKFVASCRELDNFLF